MLEDLFSLSGKTALITGGGRGIGLETAHLLGRAGASVALLDRDGAALEAAMAQLASAGHDVFAVEADVGDAASRDRAVDAVHAHFGGLDILVNNAAVVKRIPALETDAATWRQVMEVNLDAAFHLSCRACALMKENGGAIVNVASIMGLSGGGFYPLASYHASKGGLVNLTRGLAAEWGGLGIRVNAIAPGWIRTAFNSALLDQPDVAARLLQAVPLGRFAEPRDAAAAILYLVAPASRMVTGHVLAVDGGYLAC